MPKLIPGNPERILARASLWQKLQADGIVAYLSRPNLQVKRFDMQELEFNYLRTQIKALT
jgi:hypothetical protein